MRPGPECCRLSRACRPRLPRAVEQPGQLVALITRRSLVQIQSAQVLGRGRRGFESHRSRRGNAVGPVCPRERRCSRAGANVGSMPCPLTVQPHAHRSRCDAEGAAEVPSPAKDPARQRPASVAGFFRGCTGRPVLPCTIQTWVCFTENHSGNRLARRCGREMSTLHPMKLGDFVRLAVPDSCNIDCVSRGRVVALERYTDFGGTREFVYVRWFDSEGKPSTETERLYRAELDLCDTLASIGNPTV